MKKFNICSLQIISFIPLVFLLFGSSVFLSCTEDNSLEYDYRGQIEKDIVYYCEDILYMSEREKQNFLSSREAELFKKKYEEEGYRYDERDVQAFCEDKIRKTNSYRSSSSRRSSSRRSSRSRSGRSSGSSYNAVSGNIQSSAFRRVDNGGFTMGSPSTEQNRRFNENQVSVTITTSFEMMETEVTQKQWFSVMNNNPSHHKNSGDCNDHQVISGVKMCPNHPVENVSWDDVQDFIVALNNSLELTGCDGTPDSDSGCYRLPTEAEWEFAVRAGTTTAYFFGDSSSNLGSYAWYNENSGAKTHKVRQKSANPDGLYDVYGNVWEWVQDKRSNDLPGGTDPLVTTGIGRVIRGGSVRDGVVWQLRSAHRADGGQGTPYVDVGFRLVKNL